MKCQNLDRAHIHFTTAKQPPRQQNSAEFSYNPQDAVVFSPGSTTVTGLKGGEIPQTAKAVLNGPLAPSQNGNFVFPENSPGYIAANTFSAVANTIKFFEEGTGIAINWSFGKPQLEVVPDGGDMLNAYYQPANGNVNFFHSTDAVTGQTVYSGASGEVVGHEVGHAILDGLRPAYLYNWRSDVGAYHESFGDMLALMQALQDDRVLDRVMEQTGGDMRQNNVAADLGEELGVTINHKVGHNHTGGDYTRRAINSFTWKDPKELEENPKDPNELGSEVHNFSRLWTGAFYDIFCGLVDANKANGMEAREAIREASKEGLRLLGRTFKTAPKYDFTYKKMAESWLKSDRDHNGGKHMELMEKVFKSRLILPESFKPAELGPSEPVGFVQQQSDVQLTRVPLEGNLGNFTGAKVEVVKDPSSFGIAEPDTSDVERLIGAGRILYTEPNQVVREKDLFDRNGVPYAGVLVWRDGEPVIEKNRVVA